MPFHDAIDSDHRGCYCDISDRIFNKIPTEKLEKKRLIGTNSTNYESEQYIE
jgi:hypothetical protein